MRLKPGQTAPQMTPRGPKGPIKNPGGVRAAANPKPNMPIRGVGTNDGGPKPMPRGGMGMTGGPRPINPAIGAKKGGKVSSKMGKVKTGSGIDGVAERGHTKGMQPKMAKRG